MSRVSALQCDRCGAQDKYREGGDQLPKGWAQVRIEASSSYERDEYDLCEKCFEHIRDALRRPEKSK